MYELFHPEPPNLSVAIRPKPSCPLDNVQESTVTLALNVKFCDAGTAV